MDTLEALHTPFVMDTWEVEDVAGVKVLISHSRKTMCTCKPADEYPEIWGHHVDEQDAAEPKQTAS